MSQQLWVGLSIFILINTIGDLPYMDRNRRKKTVWMSLGEMSILRGANRFVLDGRQGVNICQRETDFWQNIVSFVISSTRQVTRLDGLYINCIFLCFCYSFGCVSIIQKNIRGSHNVPNRKMYFK